MGEHMNTNLKSRTWLITGIDTGFDRHMIEQLLNRGGRAADTVRKAETVNDLKGQYGDLLWLASLDMTNTPAISGVDQNR